MTVQELIDKLNELTDEQKQYAITLYDTKYCYYAKIGNINIENSDKETVVCLDE